MGRLKALAPVTLVSADERTDVTFINGRVLLHDVRELAGTLKAGNNTGLIGAGNLGIGNNQG